MYPLVSRSFFLLSSLNKRGLFRVNGRAEFRLVDIICGFANPNISLRREAILE
jgi:hypothetical protein